VRESGSPKKGTEINFSLLIAKTKMVQIKCSTCKVCNDCGNFRAL